MNTPAVEASGLRRAALALHALGRTDRDWLLQRLRVPQQESLRPLLAELAALAIPPDRRVITAALDAPTPGLGARPPAEALALCRALEREAPGLQGLLLATLPAPQRADVLAHWQAQWLPRPRPAGAAGTPPLREALLASWVEAAQDGVA